MKRTTSLKWQLLGWVLLPLLPLGFLDAWLSYRSATETATEIFDRMLLGSARIIGEEVHVENGVAHSYVPPAALELFESVYRDRVYYRVQGADGRLLLGYPELPLPSRQLHEDEVAHFNAGFRGSPLRMVAYAQPVFGDPTLNPVLIEVGQTLNGPHELAFAIWSRSVGKHLLLAILLIMLIVLGLRRGFAPLMALSAQVHARRPGALETISVDRVPLEIQPLVAAINDYVARLDEHMSAHSRFIANASHQLRTPLTVLNTQVAYGLRATRIEDKNEALEAIRQGCQQGIRVVKQLLAMSVAEARRDAPRVVAVDLNSVVRAIVEAYAGYALQRNVDLGCELPEVAIVMADDAMLRELVSNLVDNALRYCAVGGTVTVFVRNAAQITELAVEDDGPGIPAEEREKVFDRFYRLANEHSDGCGLGLAIVREVATALDAQVHLEEPPSGRGLIAVVRFRGSAYAPT